MNTSSDAGTINYKGYEIKRHYVNQHQSIAIIKNGKVVKDLLSSWPTGSMAKLTQEAKNYIDNS